MGGGAALAPAGEDSYGVGGGAQEATTQQLVFTVTHVPLPDPQNSNRILGRITLADGTTDVVTGQVLTLAQLRGLLFHTDADALSLSAAKRMDTLRFSVRDQGASEAGPELTLEESVPIYVSGNAAASQAMNVLLAPGDHVIATFPGYQSLYQVAEALGATVTRWALRPSASGWQLDLAALERTERFHIRYGDRKSTRLNSSH